MVEEPTGPEPGEEQDPTAAPPTAGERKFTDRDMAQMRRGHEAEAKKLKVDAEEFAALRAEKVKRDEAELTAQEQLAKAQESLQAANQATQDALAEAQRTRIIASKAQALPGYLHPLITGKTDEEITASIEELAGQHVDATSTTALNLLTMTPEQQTAAIGEERAAQIAAVLPRTGVGNAAPPRTAGPAILDEAARRERLAAASSGSVEAATALGKAVASRPR